MATGFYTNKIYLEHDTGNHPENADRLRAIDQHLRYSGLLNELEVRSGRIAELKESGKAESDADRELLEYGQQIGWLVALCADHHDHFRKLFVQSDQAERFVRRQMENAEELFAEDEADRTAAREIWSYFESAFGSVQRFDEFTEYAQKRLNGEDAAVPGAESPEAPDEDDSE